MIPVHDGIPTRRFPAVTVAIIAINAAVFVFQLALPAWGLTLESWFYEVGARPAELVQRTELPPSGFVPWWATLFTSLFVHGGWLHIIFNMLYLWVFGNNVEDVMTRPRFVAFYLVCGLLATMAQVFIDPGSSVPVIGASGAIAGVLGAYLYLFPRARILTVIPLLILFPVISVPAWVLLGVWIVVQTLEGVMTLGDPTAEIAFFAHIGGFLAGMAIAFVFLGHARTRRTMGFPG
jgi:membrane associated rhomboid family serine protease